jgi:hypothetical protein
MASEHIQQEILAVLKEMRDLLKDTKTMLESGVRFYCKQTGHDFEDVIGAPANWRCDECNQPMVKPVAVLKIPVNGIIVKKCLCSECAQKKA